MKITKKSVARARRTEEIKNLLDPKKGKAAENALLDYEEVIAERYAYAEKILEAQDSETLDAVDALVEKMTQMAGTPVFKHGGVSVGTPELLRRIQQKNFHWIAVRLLVACAEWDIQIANFQLPSHLCARCGKEV